MELHKVGVRSQSMTSTKNRRNEVKIQPQIFITDTSRGDNMNAVPAEAGFDPEVHAVVGALGQGSVTDFDNATAALLKQGAAKRWTQGCPRPTPGCT